VVENYEHEFHKALAISLAVEQLLVSQERLSSMELVTY
jgi:hypothetical protein